MLSELKEIAFELLEKYEDASRDLILEYSGHGDSDLEKLSEEVKEYRRRIETAEQEEQTT